MPNVKITDLPAAQALDGQELVPIVQNGVTVRTTTQAISQSPSLTQTFLTVDQEPTLPNSQSLSAGIGVGLNDNGPQSTLQIVLNGASGSLEAISTGLVVKTASNTVAARSMAVSGAGLTISNGSGISGNPTLALDGVVSSLANSGSSTGILALPGNGTVTRVTITGTANQIDLTNGDGSTGNPTVSMASNPVIPGTAAMTIPVGTTAQQPAGGSGQIRFNSDTQTFDGYASGSWRQFSLSGGVTSFSGGATGLTPATPTSGAIVLAGTLNVGSGGTGVSTLTGYVKGNGTLPFTASANIPNTDISGLGTMSTQNASNVAITGGSVAGVTITGATINGGSNTLSNIANASLVNSTVTVNGVTIDLGSSGTVYAATTNPLTVGTGLQLNSGTTFDGSAARTISIDSTVATLTGTQVLTNKTISGASNTLSNIGNSSLTNSTVTFNGQAVSLGGSGTITAVNPFALTIGTGLSGTSYNGSSGVTIAINSTVATLTGSQVLTNKTISGASNTLSNIGNSSLTNSSIAFTYSGGITGSASTSLGGTNALSLSNIPNASLANSSISFTYSGGINGSASVALGGTIAFYLASIPNSSLANSSVTIGSTGIQLGASTSTLTGLTSITVTQDPTSALQLATKQYVDNVAQGLNVKAAVAWGTTANITLSGLGTQAGGEWTGSLTAGDRILVKNQSTAANNGIYVAAAGAWSRSNDADTWAELVSAFVFVQQGATLGDTGWVCTADPGGTIGVTAVTWVQFSGAGTYTAGTGLTLTGSQFSITATGVSAATYGSASAVPVIAVNAQGQITSATTTPIAITNTQVSGLGTMSTQNANSVAITGGTIEGTTVGATTAATVRGTTITATTQFSGPGTGLTGTASGLSIGGNAATATSATTATNIAGGAAGSIAYNSGAGATTFLALGTANQVLTAGATAPQYVAQSTLSVGSATTATNIAGGTAGALAYNTGAGATTFIALGTTNYVLTAGATAPQYVAQSTLSVGYATSATNATNTGTTADSTNATNYLVFKSATTGNLPELVNASITCNPSTGKITAGVAGGTF